MPQASHQICQRRAGLRRQHGTGVAQVVELQVLPAGDFARGVPGCLELGGTQIPPAPMMEEQRLLPTLDVVHKVIGHHRHQVWRNGDVPYAGARLGPIVGDLALGPHDRATDMNHPVDGIDVLAAQLEHLAVPQRTPGAELDGQP